MTDTMVVEVGYALPNHQYLQAVKVAQGATATIAIEQSGVLKEYPEIDLTKNKVGVFGKAVKRDQYVLQPGDRVEIYRPLKKSTK
ncbi:RnfH family protein [Maricurvus nonylphenolicus]|uniref:RnfH family protein n=1 Tax=Maricurvus nonylphenolicus TaxID=1008307 RepID=UPI0036F224A4